jgi:protein-tyrosine phosphatase
MRKRGPGPSPARLARDDADVYSCRDVVVAPTSVFVELVKELPRTTSRSGKAFVLCVTRASPGCEFLARGMAMETLLFLCTGNYYRSRFAEVVFNHHAGVISLKWRATSRGLALEFGINNVGLMSADAIERLVALEIPHKEYLRMPRRVAHEDFDQVDLNVALRHAEHRPLLEQRFPLWADRVEYWHVHDVDYAGPCEALPEIEREVLTLVTRLTRPGPTTRLDPE